MTVNGISGANNGMQAGSSGRITQMDSVSKNIQNQIANAQKKLQELSSNEELSMEDKMKKRQEIQQEINCPDYTLCRYLRTDAMYPYCILNSSTHLLACHAVSRLIIAQNISSITRLGSIIPHQVFNALALTLFVFRVLTDYSDTTFSSNNFAFFTNWFN